MTFTIDAENNISAFATQEEAASSTNPFESFASQKELTQLAAAWPAERLVAIWNSLPGVEPVTTFKTAKAGANKIWESMQGLGEAAEPAKPKADKKAKGGAKAAKGAPAKGKATKKATPAKNAPKAKKTAKKEESARPRERSKTAQVVALLQRKNGATLVEIMDKMGWQRHTVRGFMAGAMKKAGYTVLQSRGRRAYLPDQSVASVPLSLPARLRPWRAFLHLASNPGVITADWPKHKVRPARANVGQTWRNGGQSLDSLDQRPVLPGPKSTATASPLPHFYWTGI